jgi:hypothetical protein
MADAFVSLARADQLDALGFLKAYRTLCTAPPAELRVMFEQVREGAVRLGNG